VPFSQPFGVDERYDREHASDFISRYGQYLRRNAGQFLDSDDEPTADPLEFAAAAWRIAQAPAMSPSYVVADPVVLGATGVWDYDHRLAIAVEVASEVPRDVHRKLRGRWRGWDRRNPWSESEDNDLPTATAVLRFRVPIEAEGLPEPEYSPLAEPVADVAKHAVQTIAGRLNFALSGVLGRVDRKEVA
jgi:hypothetical protein